MEQKMFDNDFKYEDGKLYKKRKNGKEWIYCNDKKHGNNGYINIGVNDKKYLLHRLVYLFHNPDWNFNDSCRDNSIDHRDGNKLNNKIENLQLVNHSQNNQNITHYRGKIIKGYCFNKGGRNRKLPWVATWQENGKQKSKYFKTEIEAKNYSEEMRQKLYYRPRLEIKNKDLKDNLDINKKMNNEEDKIVEEEKIIVVEEKIKKKRGRPTKLDKISPNERQRIAMKDPEKREKHRIACAVYNDKLKLMREFCSKNKMKF